MRLRYLSCNASRIVCLVILFVCSTGLPQLALAKRTHAPESSSGETKNKSSKRGPSLYPNPTTADMRAAFKDADMFYKRQEMNSALTAFDAFTKQYPKTDLADAAYYRLADIADALKKTELSRTYLKTLVDRSPDPEWRERARFLLGRSFFVSGSLDNALTTLKAVNPANLEAWQQIHYYSLMLKLTTPAQGHSSETPYYYLRLVDAHDALSKELPGNSPAWIISKKDALDFVSKWSTQTEPPAQIPSAILHYDGGPSKAYALYHVGMSYHQAGDKAMAARVFNEYLDDYSRYPNAGEIRDLLKDPSYAAFVGRNKDADKKYGSKGGYKLGVMLPLSGPYGAFGQEILRGIRCGSGEEPKCDQDNTLLLDIRDTQGSQEIAQQLYTDFERDNDVRAILGPMSTKATLALLPEITKHDDLAIISLSQGEIVNRPAHLLNALLTPQAQTERLVDHLIRKNLKHVAVLYPNNGYGLELSTLFERALSARGIKLASKQGYRPDGGDIAQAVRQLKTNASYVSDDLKGGFQAIFIPDSMKRVERFMPALSAANLSNTTLLGTNAWNSAPFSQTFEASYPNSVFTDLFTPSDSRSETADLIKRFTKAYGRAPTTLEAIGYDLARLLASAKGKGDSKAGKSRKSLLNSLLDSHAFRGATTLKGFDANGEMESTVQLITQHGGVWQLAK